MNKELIFRVCTIVLMSFRYNNYCTFTPIMLFSFGRACLSRLLVSLLSVGGFVHVGKPRIRHVQGGNRKQSAKVQAHLGLSSAGLLPQSRIRF
jgi:hypothetical protein